MKNTIGKIIIMSLIVFFFVLLFAEEYGYYQTKDQKAKILTEEQIKVFEDDISNGKNVDITDYVKTDRMNYTNNVSKKLYKVSLKLECGVDKVVKYIFRGASKAVSDN